jgi:hypothetical protein
VKPLQRADERRVFEDGAQRVRVDVQVECCTQKAANTLRPYIPDGAKVVSPDHDKWTVSLDAENPDLFLECLQWKYNVSVSKWKKCQQDLDDL